VIKVAHFIYSLWIVYICFNPFKSNDAKWLHFKVFKAILV